MWWICFTLISDREVKKGFRNATLLEFLYVPTLLSLGLIAASFTQFFDIDPPNPSLLVIFGIALRTFLMGVSLVGNLLEFPEQFHRLKKPIRRSLMLTALFFLLAAFIRLDLSCMQCLLGALVVLVMEIVYLNSVYYRFVYNSQKH